MFSLRTVAFRPPHEHHVPQEYDTRVGLQAIVASGLEFFSQPEHGLKGLEEEDEGKEKLQDTECGIPFTVLADRLKSPAMENV